MNVYENTISDDVLYHNFEYIHDDKLILHLISGPDSVNPKNDWILSLNELGQSTHWYPIGQHWTWFLQQIPDRYGQHP